MSRTKKDRITVTMSHALAAAIADSVESGDAESVSAWLSAAAAEFLGRTQRRKALSEAIASYEREFGTITREEVEQQLRRDREDAIVFRGKRKRGAA